MKQATGDALRAVVDRFEGELAVVLVGPEEAELVMARQHLPVGATEGAILRLRFEWDRAETEALREQMRRRLERLKQRS
jgi:hypothetical protein